MVFLVIDIFSSMIGEVNDVLICASLYPSIKPPSVMAFYMYIGDGFYFP